MRKFLLIAIFSVIIGTSYGTIVTITNSGFTFSPDLITIDPGDTVIFDLESIHNAVEVSEETWNANGNTPLPGFSVPFGGGMVTGLEPGTHFYVCQPHASLGMKGRIIVNILSGIGENKAFDQYFRIYPNPTHGILYLQNQSSVTGNNPSFSVENQSSLEIYNILGEKVYEMQGINMKREQELDISSLPEGQYILRFSNGREYLSKVLVKVQ